jgi:hypothetical protein
VALFASTGSDVGKRLQLCHRCSYIINLGAMTPLGQQQPHFSPHQCSQPHSAPKKVIAASVSIGLLLWLASAGTGAKSQELKTAREVLNTCPTPLVDPMLCIGYVKDAVELYRQLLQAANRSECMPHVTYGEADKLWRACAIAHRNEVTLPFNGFVARALMHAYPCP